MSRLLKEPVKKRTLKGALKGTRRGLILTYPGPPTPGRINRKKYKSNGRLSKR
jgi:hypothetical protein